MGDRQEMKNKIGQFTICLSMYFPVNPINKGNVTLCDNSSQK